MSHIMKVITLIQLFSSFFHQFIVELSKQSRLVAPSLKTQREAPVAIVDSERVQPKFNDLTASVAGELVSCE